MYYLNEKERLIFRSIALLKLLNYAI